jgi:hypothetical protein
MERLVNEGHGLRLSAIADRSPCMSPKNGLYITRSKKERYFTKKWIVSPSLLGHIPGKYLEMPALVVDSFVQARW